MDEQGGLAADDPQDARVGVPKRIHADASDQVQVALAIDVIQVTPFPAAHHQGVPAVVLQ